MSENLSSPSPGRRPFVRTTGRFQIIAIAYIVAAFTYLIYSDSSESGLYAYLMKLQMDIIGEAEETVTGILTLGVLLAPLLAICAVAATFAPSLVWVPSGVGLPKPGTLDERLNRAVQLTQISWKVVCAVTAIPIVVAAVLFAVMNYSDQRDQHEKVYPIDLTSGVKDPPKEAKFVALSGMMARPYAVILKRSFLGSDTYDLFAPITGNSWNTTDPVRYFVHYQSHQESSPEAQWPNAFRQKGVAQFSGKISRLLPGFVEAELRSKGLKLGPSYLVIDWKNLQEHRVPSSSGDATIDAGICLIFVPFVFIVMILLKLMVTNINRKKQPELR